MRSKKLPVCILDPDKERCVREEKALEAAVLDSGLAVSACANYGAGYITRTGFAGPYPANEVEGLFFNGPIPEAELTYEMLRNFLDMLVRRNVVPPPHNRPAAERENNPVAKLPRAGADTPLGNGPLRPKRRAFLFGKMRKNVAAPQAKP